MFVILSLLSHATDANPNYAAAANAKASRQDERKDETYDTIVLISITDAEPIIVAVIGGTLIVELTYITITPASG